MIGIKAEIKTEEIDIKSEYLYDEMFDSQNPEPPLLSDDIWNKFELDFPELTDMDDIFKELDTGINENSLFNLLNDCEIRNHDCMWAGHCGSKEHPADEPRLLQTIVPQPPIPVIKQTAPSHIKQNPQSLLKPRVNLQNTTTIIPPVNLIHTPQTPPMSDDEEGKSKKNDLAKILQEIVTSEIDLPDVDDEDIEEFPDLDDEDDELEEDDEDDKIQQQQKEQRYAASYAANDHSYHKEKNSYVLDTPSDSEEEEIDVVSVEKSFNRMPSSLPTNPSTRDRQQLQRRMATAISRKRIPQSSNNSGIKTLMPLKKSSSHQSGESSSSSSTTSKRRIQESRGVKRSKQYRMPANNSPYKKRHVYGNSSDSEPEPSEKRSLHNNMERQRRIDLRNAFEDLRMLVPEVSKKERAAKVVILREAAQYCDSLGRVSQNYNRQCEELKRQQEWLRQRVSQLRRNLAAKR